MQITSAALLISIALVVFGIAYYYFTTRHKERMAIIENKLPSDTFKGTENYLPLILMLSMVSIGISAGIMVGMAIIHLGFTTNDYIMPACIFLFLGLSLLTGYFLLKPKS